MSKLYYRLNIDEKPIDLLNGKSSPAENNEQRIELVKLTDYSEEQETFVLNNDALDVKIEFCKFRNYLKYIIFLKMIGAFEGKIGFVMIKSDENGLTLAFLKQIFGKEIEMPKVPFHLNTSENIIYCLNEI